ncbi:MAG: Type secretion system protein precursor [Verrucomicrobiota bacterium]|jgi:prepilin-type N-terminal cleavage/methylation domain-containing protein
MKHVPARPAARRGFTLIELLVVIAIIGILAGLITYLLPGVKEKQIRGRARAELNLISAAIKNYKVKKGFYPPDNPSANATASTSLFYELTGSDILPAVTNLFGVTGVANAGAEAENFLAGLKTSSYRTQPGNANATNLVFGYKGPSGDFNPWNYDSSNPTHNPDSFDLWIDVVIGNKTVTIGNWND